MEIEKVGEKLEKFIEESKHCQGIAMEGCYGLGVTNFVDAFKHYLETGKNVLDEHAEIWNLGWNTREWKQHKRCIYFL